MTVFLVISTTQKYARQNKKKEHNIAAANELLGRNSFQNYIR